MGTERSAEEKISQFASSSAARESVEQARKAHRSETTIASARANVFAAHLVREGLHPVFQKAVDALISAVRAESVLPPSNGKSTDWGLANVYTIARRRLNSRTLAESEREWWQHVVRIAEESGVKQPGVLRHAVPTEITEGSALPPPPEQTWQPIDDEAKKSAVLIALIRDGKVWRVSDAKHNGLSFYTINGGIACHWATHWMPLPAPPTEAK